MKLVLFTLIPLIFSILLAVSYVPVFASHGGNHDESMGQHGMKEKMMGHHHMAHKGMCAPGFSSLDGMCVLDDRCGPGVYPGKVCMMDGVMKEYLRPHHQKHAGISAENIVCAEGKHLMFKHHDATPACVNSHSVDKLKHRGWQTEMPPIACTMEYNPVCGVDGITYGNMCGLKAQHMAMKHHGECIISTSMDSNESFSISPTELEQQITLDPNMMIIDMRDTNFYMDGHIEGSAVDVMEGTTLEKRIKTMFSKIPKVIENTHVVLVSDSESKAIDSAKTMNDAGIKTSYLSGGIHSWDGNLSTKMTPTLISSAELYTQLQNQEDIFLLDVREPEELETTMISGNKNIPIADIFIEDNISEIPTDKPVVVICKSGNRATVATYELAKYDIDYQVLDGGMTAWDKYLDDNNLN